MELVLDEKGDGTTLEDKRKSGRLEPSDVRKWFDEVREALNYLHSCGVVHRDVKLENILIDRDNHAILADLGVARIVDRDLKTELDVSTTFVTGEDGENRPVMGTGFYLSPNIRKGANATPQDDHYALGVAFFRLLTGMWYEPGTNASGLLAPFDGYWRRELPLLLGCSGEVRRGRPRKWPLFAVMAAIAVSLLVAIMFAVARRTPQADCATTGTEATADLFVSFPDGSIMDFARCPAGEFQMPNPKGSNEPCHLETIGKPFWISKKLVSVRQFGSVMPNIERDSMAWEWETACNGYDIVARIWMPDVTKFVDRLASFCRASLPDGYVLRLASEAELVYAITEGGKTPQAWSDVAPDTTDTHKLADAKNLAFRDDIRVIAPRIVNGWGLQHGWTECEQAVCDVTTNSFVVFRQGNKNRFAFKPTWINTGVRLCVGPPPITSH